MLILYQLVMGKHKLEKEYKQFAKVILCKEWKVHGR
jgi:hypothetical protein